MYKNCQTKNLKTTSYMLNFSCKQRLDGLKNKFLFVNLIKLAVYRYWTLLKHLFLSIAI